MSEIFVVKRSGKKEKLNTGKIKEVISWACKDLDVNPLELESKIQEALVDNVGTVRIHDNIIHHAQTLASVDTPDWVYVAGRLNTMKRWKDTGAYDMSFSEYVDKMKEKGTYTHPAILSYSEEEIAELGSYINADKDLDLSYGATLTGFSKYLKEGECVQLMFMVEAMIIFSKKKNRLERVVELYTALSDRKISLASPWLSNLRGNGNISSCFIIAMDDDLESITGAWAKAASVSKMGGGLGIYMGNLRAKGGTIAGRPNSAKSICSPIKVFNDIAGYIDQGGTRAGAFTTALPIWHNDIEDFLEIQHESGDIRSKAFDIFPQVCTPDLFWETDEKQGTWYTFCPHECKENGVDLNNCYGEEFNSRYHKAVSLYKQGVLSLVTEHKARDLVKKFMRTQVETGLPYIAFTDAINEANPNKHEGIIPCVNLCVESFSVVNSTTYDHTCNLASLVAGRMKDYEDFIYFAGLVTEVLDSGIELTSPPTTGSKYHNSSFRTVGTGIQGYHDWLAKSWKTYEDTEEATRVAEYIEYGAILKSIELAKELGAYPKFKGSDWDNGAMIARFKSHSVTSLDWDHLQGLIDLYGIRNSQLTSPAPNTSTSCFMDAGAGVIPVYSPFFREDNSNGKYPVTCMHIKENPLSYSRSFRTYDQSVLAKTIGAMQKMVDTGISAEYLFDQNKESFTAKDIYDMFTTAWKARCKAVYYIRSIKKGESVEDLLGIKEEGCVGCAG